MALTREDKEDIIEIVNSRNGSLVEAIKGLQSSISDIKDRLYQTIDSHSEENERVRASVRDLYEKRTELIAELSRVKEEFLTKVNEQALQIKELEKDNESIQRDLAKSTERARFGISQWLVVLGVVVMVVFGVIGVLK